MGRERWEDWKIKREVLPYVEGGDMKGHKCWRCMQKSLQVAMSRANDQWEHVKWIDSKVFP